MFNFASPHDANARLSESLIRVKGKPALVLGIDGGFCMTYKYLTSSVLHTIDVHSKAVNFKPVALGYMNYVDGATYLMRRPERRWKQGLMLSSVIMLNPPAKRLRSYPKELQNTILGKYPSFASAQEKSKDRRCTVAFHRTLAVRMTRLFFKTVPIGNVKDGLVLKPEYAFMKEYVEGVIA